MELPSITFFQGALTQFDEMTRKEWLVTNGLGSYASSTVLGVNTRKYHGLLVAALHPPKDRRVFLAKLDEDIEIGKDVYRLGTNQFVDVVFPKGYQFLRQFSVSPFPEYAYHVRNVNVTKTIFMPHEKNITIAIYRFQNSNQLETKVRVYPLTSLRHFHSVTDRRKVTGEPCQKHDDSQLILCSDIPDSVLLISTLNGRYFPRGNWIDRLYFREEADRGESCFDDCYQPGYFEISVKAGAGEDFVAFAIADENEDAAKRVLESLPTSIYDVKELYRKEAEYYETLINRFYGTHRSARVSDWLSWVILATNAFLVRSVSEQQKAVITGYHWFGTWGRDTFVSLPGLTLVTGRFGDAKELFLSFKRYCREGLIPNFLTNQTGAAMYNTVDATLWYVNAVLQYLKYTGDFEFVQKQLWKTLKTIFEKHVSGTLFNIHVDGDGLLSHGPQLTWMDAVVDGKPITPRSGRAVEIQALWYNALKTMELLADRFSENTEEETFARMAEKAKRSFARKFWNSGKNCLYDAVDDEGRDGSLRPNQILAVSLDFMMLDETRNSLIVDGLQRELMTPYGLRTLEKSDPRYIGFYAGDRRSRDKAYHNGTVWPWLLGPFTTAFLKTKGYSESLREYAMTTFLGPLFTKHILEAGLGTVSEIFDGEPPYMPRGCISQAWSVAEPFRSYVEDVEEARPTYEAQVLRSVGQRVS
jgi:predicted glycogen debranching enzyme